MKKTKKTKKRKTPKATGFHRLRDATIAVNRKKSSFMKPFGSRIFTPLEPGPAGKANPVRIPQVVERKVVKETQVALRPGPRPLEPSAPRPRGNILEV